VSTSNLKFTEIINNNENQLKKLVATSNNWTTISHPLTSYGNKLENLLTGKKNISMLINILNIYSNIRERIDKLRELNKKEENIVHVYKNIRYLIVLQKSIIEKLRMSDDLNSKKETINIFMKNLSYVNDFEKEFFDKFWAYFENTLELAQKKPGFLVKLLRLVEEDQNYIFDIKSQIKSIIRYVMSLSFNILNII